MARAEIPFVVIRSSAPVSGSDAEVAVSGASVQVNVRGGGPATVYGAETGAGTITNPITTDADGRINGWLEEGAYDLTVSGAGIASYTTPWNANPAVPSTLAANSVATAQLQDGSVTSAKIADGTITLADLNAAVLNAYLGHSDGTPRKIKYVTAQSAPNLGNNTISWAQWAIPHGLPHAPVFVTAIARGSAVISDATNAPHSVTMNVITWDATNITFRGSVGGQSNNGFQYDWLAIY